jgi:hypothetical protein
MKVRTGFVSNSSSSSYVCEICGSVMEDDDDDMVTCERQHTFCVYHLKHALFRKRSSVPILPEQNRCRNNDKRELNQLIRAVDPLTFNTVAGIALQ